MRTITLEEHFATKDFLIATNAYGDQTPPWMKQLQPKLLDLGAGRIAEMDSAKIDLQVLSLCSLGIDHLDAATETPLCTSVNDELAAAVRANPTRLAGFAALPMKNPAAAAKELQRAVETLGFRGAMVDGTTDGLFLDDPRFTPIFEAAVALNVPIYLHPAPPPKAIYDLYFANLPGQVGDMLSIAGWGWHAETALHTLRLIVSGVFDRFPTLQLIIGHMGEMLPMALVRTSAALSRAAKIERPVESYFQTNIHLTTSGYFTQPPLDLALRVVGIDRMMFSVDYPFSTNDKGRDYLNSLTLSSEDMQKLTHTNAEALLKLT